RLRAADGREVGLDRHARNKERLVALRAAAGREHQRRAGKQSQRPHGKFLSVFPVPVSERVCGGNPLGGIRFPFAPPGGGTPACPAHGGHACPPCKPLESLSRVSRQYNVYNV